MQHKGGLLYISKNFQLSENSLVHHKSPVKKSNNSTKNYPKNHQILPKNQSKNSKNLQKFIKINKTKSQKIISHQQPTNQTISYTINTSIKIHKKQIVRLNAIKIALSNDFCFSFLKENHFKTFFILFLWIFFNQYN